MCDAYAEPWEESRSLAVLSQTKRADQDDLNSLVKDPLLTSKSPKLSLPSLPIEYKRHAPVHTIQDGLAMLDRDMLLFDPS
jgi:hypothetical protein